MTSMSFALKEKTNTEASAVNKILSAEYKYDHYNGNFSGRSTNLPQKLITDKSFSEKIAAHIKKLGSDILLGAGKKP